MTFDNLTPVERTSASEIHNIDALISKIKWQSKTVTYSFTNNFILDYGLDYQDYDGHSGSFESLNTTQREVSGDWFAMYEDVSLLNTVELTGVEDRDATIRIAESDHPSTGYAYLPNRTVEAGDIWFNSDNFNTPNIGNYAFILFGHEIGHALGLKHGHENGGVSDISLYENSDSMEFSIMTYRSYVGGDDDGYTNEEWGFAQSLMMYDIRAIQEMYGANFNTNSSNTTYRFSPSTGEMLVNGIGQGTPGDNRIFRTIWDGNGTDTYDFSNYKTNLDIDLRPGRWSDLEVGGNEQRADLGNDNIHYARGHVFNALQYDGDSRSLIENTNGGSGNDSILGNEMNNLLIGGYGRDTIDGDLGNDTLYGDNTNNDYWGDADVLLGNSGNDALYAGGGNDRVEGNAGKDVLFGKGGDDALTGGSSTDVLFGGSGNDTLTGSYPGESNSGKGEYDKLTGGSGADVFVLGDSVEAHYRDFGYAIITDFNRVEGDKLMAFGSSSSYSLNYSDSIGSSVRDTIVKYQEDVIAIIEDNTDISLNQDFDFV